VTGNSAAPVLAKDSQEGGLKIEKFAVFRNPDGTVHVPMWTDEQELGTAMDAIWSNFFHFVEGFTMLALQFRVLDEKFSMFQREEPATSPKPSWASCARPTAIR
jgi:hypothetical protein